MQRLLSRFTSQGFSRDVLARAAVCLYQEPVPRVILLGRLSLYGQGASRLHDEIVAVSARWTEPENRGRKKLAAEKQAENRETLTLLEDALADPHFHEVPERISTRLLGAAVLDMAEMATHLQRRADSLVEGAKKKLASRGQVEANEMETILQRQQKRIGQHKAEIEGQLQLPLTFSKLEAQQLADEKQHWAKRIETIKDELVSEPERIRSGYQVRNQRFETVGLIYLWPTSA